MKVKVAKWHWEKSSDTMLLPHPMSDLSVRKKNPFAVCFLYSIGVRACTSSIFVFFSSEVVPVLPPIVLIPCVSCICIEVSRPSPPMWDSVASNLSPFALPPPSTLICICIHICICFCLYFIFSCSFIYLYVYIHMEL